MIQCFPRLDTSMLLSFHSVTYNTDFPPQIILPNLLLKIMKVVHSCNTSTQEAEEDPRFKDSLDHLVKSCLQSKR